MWITKLNALKTIISRIYQSKTIDPNVTDEDLSKTSAMLHQLGISVRDTTGAYRNLSNIFSDIQKAENGMTDSQKEALAYRAAGIRQANIFAAAIDTVGKAQTLTNAAISSSGELYNANAKYMDTISAKLKVLSSTITSLWLKLINSNSINIFISGLTGLINGISNVTSGLGSFGTTLGIITAALIIFRDKLGLTTLFKSFTAGAEEATIATESLTTAEEEATIATEGFSLSTGGLLAILGVLAFGISSLINYINKQTIETAGLTQAQADAKTQAEQTLKTYQDQASLHQTMIQQYQDEINSVNQIADTRKKLVAQLNDEHTTDQQKIDINAQLVQSESDLQVAVGATQAANVSNAKYSQEAFQSLTKSLQDKQNAEKAAWDAANKNVAHATDVLKQNILAQMTQVENATKAYGIFAKLQESILAMTNWGEQNGINALKAQLKITPDDAYTKAQLKSLEAQHADTTKQISSLYINSQAQEIEKLKQQFDQLGGTLGGSSGSTPPLPGDNGNSGASGSSASGSNSTTSTPAAVQTDILSAQIRSYNYTADQDKLESSILQKKIQTAKTAKDYNSELALTNSLLSNQQKQINDLNSANQQINQEKSHVKSQYGFDSSSWFDLNGNSTLAYETAYQDALNKKAVNSKDKTAQFMKSEFDALDKLNKAEQTNKNTIDTLTSSNQNLASTLPTIQFDLVTDHIKTFTDSISESNTQLDLSKSRMELLNTTSSEYTQELTNQTNIYKQLLVTQQQSIDYMTKELQNTNLSVDAKASLTKQIEAGTKAELGYQKAIETNNVTLAIGTAYDLQQKQNSELQKALDLQLKITEAENPKNYDAINVILASQISSQQTNLSQIQSAITSLTTQRDMLSQTSAEWQTINDKVATYQSTLESAQQTLSDTYKSQLTNSINQQLQQTELNIFGGQTEAQAKQALQDQSNYNNEYMTGAEKAATVLMIQNQVLQDNAALNNGILGTQQNQVQLSQAQLAILNSSSDIKRSDLTILQDQLAIQKTQAELANAQNQKSIRVLTDEGGGNYQWNWEADQTKVLQLQGTLYQEQANLAKQQLDDQQKDDQTALDQKSEYYNNIKTVVQNGLNGMYSDTTTFNTNMTNANTEFLNSLQGNNKSTWDTVANDTQSNINTMLTAYQTYVTNMATLQATLNQIKASSSTTPLSVPDVNSTLPPVLAPTDTTLPASITSQFPVGTTFSNIIKNDNGTYGFETHANGGVVGGGNSDYTTVSLMDIASGKLINGEKPILAKPGELILNQLQQTNLLGNFQSLLSNMPSFTPNTNNTSNVNNNGITIENMVVQAQNVNDLVSQLQNFVHLTNTNFPNV